jgi:putative transposase
VPARASGFESRLVHQKALIQTPARNISAGVCCEAARGAEHPDVEDCGVGLSELVLGLALLQKNVLNRRRWATRDELRIAIVTWIERTYHRRRRQPVLGRLTPIEFETIMPTPADQAA